MCKPLLLGTLALLILHATQAQNSGIAQTCLSTHIFNGCGTVGYLTFGFTPTTGANTANPDPLTIQQSNLSVGVNVNNPMAKFQIRGAGTTDASSSLLVTNSANTESFRILDNGNVGIGTPTPQSTLAVNGIITTRKIRVSATGWPDFVFDSSYHLPDLDAVERFISAHRHLPGIISEDEAKKDGVDLGDNQTVMLQKVEELTLYVIRQNKQLQTQNERLERQDREIEALKEAVKRLSAKH